MFGPAPTCECGVRLAECMACLKWVCEVCGYPDSRLAPEDKCQRCYPLARAVAAPAKLVKEPIDPYTTQPQPER
jgi:hypothetical protein